MSHIAKSMLTPDEEAEVRRLKDDSIISQQHWREAAMWYRV